VHAIICFSSGSETAVPHDPDALATAMLFVQQYLSDMGYTAGHPPHILLVPSLDDMVSAQRRACAKRTRLRRGVPSALLSGACSAAQPGAADADEVCEGHLPRSSTLLEVRTRITALQCVTLPPPLLHALHMSPVWVFPTCTLVKRRIML